MKQTLTLIMVLSMTIAALSLSACSKSDDDNNGSDYGIVGTWFGYECSDNNANDLDTEHTLKLVFNANGTGLYDEYEVLDANKCSFTYSTEGTTKGKAYISSIENTIYFVIEGRKMYVYGNGYGKDLDFLLTKQ